MTFTITDYEKLRTDWGQFVKFEPVGDKQKQLGVRFQNNRLTVGVKMKDENWTDNNCITVSTPIGYADFEARFVDEINELIRLITS